MGLIMSLVLGSVGLVLIKTAFNTPPDPRVVLKDLFSGNFKIGEFTDAQKAFVGSRSESDIAKHPAATTPPPPPQPINPREKRSRG